MTTVPWTAVAALAQTKSQPDLKPELRGLFNQHNNVVSLRVGSLLPVFVADRCLTQAALMRHGSRWQTPHAHIEVSSG
jgi:hypothetical protein